MIELTFTEMAITVVVAALILTGGFSILSRWSHRAEERRATRRRMVCRVCGHAWENDSRERIVPCPACGTPNRKGRDLRLG